MCNDYSDVALVALAAMMRATVVSARDVMEKLRKGSIDYLIVPALTARLRSLLDSLSSASMSRCCH